MQRCFSGKEGAQRHGVEKHQAYVRAWTVMYIVAFTVLLFLFGGFIPFPEWLGFMRHCARAPQFLLLEHWSSDFPSLPRGGSIGVLGAQLLQDRLWASRKGCAPPAEDEHSVWILERSTDFGGSSGSRGQADQGGRHHYYEQ